jgi:hypothetical protein
MPTKSGTDIDLAATSGLHQTALVDRACTLGEQRIEGGNRVHLTEVAERE